MLTIGDSSCLFDMVSKRWGFFAVGLFASNG